jgi:hypothetical protein
MKSFLGESTIKTKKPQGKIPSFLHLVVYLYLWVFSLYDFGCKIRFFIIGSSSQPQETYSVIKITPFC